MTEFLGRALPQWFNDAKLGIFIHWYTSSVPAFAPLSDDPFTIAERSGWAEAMRGSPYAEWYWNSLALGDSPVAEHHRATYGDKPYADFVSEWASAVQDWEPSEWVTLFQRAGAQYVVAGTKHHDGVLLWPSATQNPHRERWNAGRDLISPLIDGVRAAGMRAGLYYSGGLDWTFAGPGAVENPHGIGSFEDMVNAIPRSTEYAEYVHAHWIELIDRYQPDVLWNDISHPIAGNWKDLFAYYYNAVPTGVVNDRFDMRGVMKGTSHADFVTPEYRTSTATKHAKFEVCRGIGRSFGYNAQERDEDFLTPNELIWDFVDIVARGGNLLLNVGPTARGEIPFAQRLRLEALGSWLAINGAAIYATRPCRVTSGTAYSLNAGDTGAVRFTQSGDQRTMYAIVQGGTQSRELVITGMTVREGATIRLIDQRRDASLTWSTTTVNNEPAISVTLPCPQPHGAAFTLVIEPS
jgi:alpha-L-fucosidase